MSKAPDFFEETESLSAVTRQRPNPQDPRQVRDVNQLEAGMVVEKVRKDGSVERMAILAVGQGIKFSADAPPQVVDHPDAVMVLYESPECEDLVPATRHLGDLGVLAYNAGAPQEWWNASVYLRLPEE